jgi:hypothetical protein
LCAGTDPEDKRNRNHGANNTARVEELTDGLAAIVLAACPEMVPILTQHGVLHTDVDFLRCVAAQITQFANVLAPSTDKAVRRHS